MITVIYGCSLIFLNSNTFLFHFPIWNLHFSLKSLKIEHALRNAPLSRFSNVLKVGHFEEKAHESCDVINFKTKKEVPKIIFSRTENEQGMFDFEVFERKNANTVT